MEEKFDALLEYWPDNAKLATPGCIALLRFYLTRFRRKKEIIWT
jgi:hypothetical protein